MGQVGAAQLLLRSGASVNLSGPLERTPLMLACTQPSMEALVDTLLNYEGDPAQKDVRGWTALE
jgi:ankyrin repeat protein